MPNKSVMNFVLAMLFCVLSPLAFTANNYTTAWSSGVFDDTDYLSSESMWLGIPGGGTCRVPTLHLAYSGDLICIGTDSYVYMMPTGTLSWVQHTEFGISMLDIIEANPQHIYALGPTKPDCASRNLPSVYKWSGTAWAEVTGCLSQMRVGEDLTLVGADSHYGQSWISTDEGASWKPLTTQSQGWAIYANVFNAQKICVLIGGQLRMSVAGSAVGTFPVQPNNSDVGMQGCEVGPDTLMVWSSKTSQPTVGVQQFNFNTNMWSQIIGFYPAALESHGKGLTMAMNISGNPYHLNDLPAFVSGLMTGSVDGCPPGTPCSTINPPTHTGDLVVTFPHGICKANPNDSRCPTYATHHLAIPPTSNMYIQSWDLSPVCDPLFGDPSSSECQPESAGSVICSVSLVNLADSSANNPPGLKGLSYYLAEFNGNILSNVTRPIPGGWVTATECYTDNACSPMTQNSAVCMPPYIDDFVTSHTTLPDQIGPLVITYTMAQNFGVLSCEIHDGQKPTYLVWRVVSRYNVKVGAISCKPFPILETTLYGDQCF